MEQPHGEDHGLRRRRVVWVIEVTASAGSVLAVLIIFVNFVSAYVCFFGAQCVPDDQQIGTYGVLAVVTPVLVLVTFGAGVYNRRRWLFVWHGLVAAVTVAALFLLAVPTIGSSDPSPQVTTFENGEQCYTGGTPFCQGG